MSSSVGSADTVTRPLFSSASEPAETLIWTDGACQGNPGPGGWAAILVSGDAVLCERSGSAAQTTNNRMEMMAALEGLSALGPGARACVVTDSRYLCDGMTSWLEAWKRRGWRTAAGAPVKNDDLWRALDAAAPRGLVRWRWTRGHCATPLNERADALAVAAAAAAAGTGAGTPLT